MNHVRYQLACLYRWALLLVLGVVQVAHAQGTATVTQYAYNNLSGSQLGPWVSSYQEACNGAAQWQATANNTTCTITMCQPGGMACNLPGGYVYNIGIRSQTAAGTLPCPAAGTKKVVNVTAGYVNSPNAEQDISNLPSLVGRTGQNMCAASGGSSCTYTIGNAVSSWTSLQPTATGLYRVSDDWEMTATGGSCTATADETKQTDASAAVPPCPGAFGTVNGKPVCVPTTSAGTSRPAASTSNRAGNPSAGSDGTQPLPNRSPSTGTNNANNGSAPTSSDGTPMGGRGTPPPAGTGTAAGSGTSLDPSQIKTDCDKYPNSVGCSQFGSAESGPLTTTNVTLDTTPTQFASSGGCPAPLTFSVMASTYTVSYQPLCDRLFALRVLFLLSASFIAAYIIANGFKT